MLASLLRMEQESLGLRGRETPPLAAQRLAFVGGAKPHGELCSLVVEAGNTSTGP